MQIQKATKMAMGDECMSPFFKFQRLLKNKLLKKEAKNSQNFTLNIHKFAKIKDRI